MKKKSYILKLVSNNPYYPYNPYNRYNTYNQPSSPYNYVQASQQSSQQSSQQQNTNLQNQPTNTRVMCTTNSCPSGEQCMNGLCQATAVGSACSTSRECQRE